MNQTDTKTKEEYPEWVLDENGEPIIYQYLQSVTSIRATAPHGSG